LNPGEAASGYQPAADFRQPHWQLFSWQRHASFGQPQEQVSHPQAQPELAAVLAAGFFRLDMVFLLFSFLRFMRFQRG
jgi:hypothetical protein